ncbi:Tat pathway signal sequence domain protein [Phenylobacterium sp. J426]|uniref:Tat pathway signal sequence domain protein n=1 Tax=Phenylobacterium sp. J426 TaxID=2898439 RepID=UPI002151B3F7|nr:Tat pathway signal sequence domain protein [Phenylobacterium sp. J426]MCR5873288.1 Tat pathway signal sequence domain protein [Phenylobacterium sp. J426]
MRRHLLVAAAAVLSAAVALPEIADAQGRGRGGQQQQQEDDAAKRRKRDAEWGDSRAPLPALRNAGPCPFVKTLYDAARYVEFKDGREASANVGFSGEIQGISAGCEYKDDKPIEVAMEVLFELGRGPQAEGRAKTYRYWVAVTDRNRSVLEKQVFDLPVTFKEGEDRVYVRETLKRIVIPRAEMTTSGANFEILVGFDVTPQMAAFNREGKRFRLNVGGQASTTAGSPTPQ